ncbi:MAG: hypothetical protein IPG04_21190 [Polyangiaceae bacterium]|nr:hypothetical protein [Polyangiaceae bacterium]
MQCSPLSAAQSLSDLQRFVGVLQAAAASVAIFSVGTGPGLSAAVVGADVGAWLVVSAGAAKAATSAGAEGSAGAAATSVGPSSSAQAMISSALLLPALALTDLLVELCFVQRALGEEWGPALSRP